MSANDNFSLHDDEELSLHDDASLDGSVPASNKGDAPAKPPQIITTNTLSNIKLPVLQKDDYDTWAMEMEHYLEYIDNEVWKVIQNGNSKKRVTKGKDGVYRVLPPTTQEEQFADEKERKARTLLLMAVPKDHLRRFHGMDDAKEIWAAIKTRFGGSKLPITVWMPCAGVSDEDANMHSFFEVPSLSGKNLAMTMRTKKIYCSLIKPPSSKHKPSTAQEVIDKKFLQQKTGEGQGVDGKMQCAFDKRKVEEVKVRIQASANVRSLMSIDEVMGSLEVYHASSTLYSTCQSNDSDGELGAVSDHSVNDDPIHDIFIYLYIEQVTNATLMTQPLKCLNPHCQQNWNQRMERDLGAGYSFERKPCFVCGSLSHLIKNCDYYEKKMAREAALKSKRVVHADVRQATPAWTNTNRVNKANQFTPRPVQLNLIMASIHVNSGSVHVNSGTQFKSGTSRFNTGKQHVNSGSVHVNSGTQFKSGTSRFNTGKQHVNSGSVHFNNGRVNRPVSNNTSPKPSQVNLKSPKKCFSKQRSPVNRPFSRNTAYKSNNYAVKGKMGTAVKTSAGCVWRKIIPSSNTNSGQRNLKFIDLRTS
ncbi:hypothetical protein Tco_0749189 [Tanacetum coccineum]|uniref:Uncharacterized protein n=1 Tax=Tanacetum coccineum TaxID=301880 RepID=A0ABQ4YXP6_9ASTR